MRSLFVTAMVLLGACSAVDDFTQFRFSDGGVVGGGDGGGGDMTALPQFGEACTTVCANDPLHPLTCIHMFGQRPVPGGVCSHACNPALGNLDCAELPSAVCAVVENTPVCLPSCDLGSGHTCRALWSCCNGMGTASSGYCAPTDANVCK
jgi:hypothetical protein